MERKLEIVSRNQEADSEMLNWLDTMVESIWQHMDHGC